MAIDKKAIGRNVATCRKNAKLTQEQLAEKVNLTNQQVSYIETGHSGMSLESLIKIANVLGTTLDPLVVSELENNKREIISNEVARFLERLSTEDIEFLFSGIGTMNEFVDFVKKYIEFKK